MVYGWRRAREPSCSRNDEGHGNSILKNGQQVFTTLGKYGKGEKSPRECGIYSMFCYVDSWGYRMNGTKSTFAFRKTAACPASATLLSYRTDNLPADVATSIREHLKLCDFCSAELPLLAFHEPTSDTFKAPEIPMNLRILAESILIRIKSV
jgi:hypothetical protein